MAAGAAAASPVAPSSTPSLVLVSQSAAVVPSAPGQPAPFQVTVAVRGDPPPGSELGLAFYEKLESRSAFEQTLSGRPSGLMQDVAPEPLTALRPVGAGLQLATDVVAGTTEPAGSTTVGLDGHGGCVPGDGECSGVYPVVVQLLSPQGWCSPTSPPTSCMPRTAAAGRSSSPGWCRSGRRSRSPTTRRSQRRSPRCRQPGCETWPN